ncbi:hypothetical protein AX14_008337 [Amanita brunnescens Koide BX004]|nr:hypothetical protein AX14_008337 [Amanita brunnescens Koide BX004]
MGPFNLTGAFFTQSLPRRDNILIPRRIRIHHSFLLRRPLRFYPPFLRTPTPPGRPRYPHSSHRGSKGARRHARCMEQKCLEGQANKLVDDAGEGMYEAPAGMD